MSHPIRIISIELENYRQYFGKHKIDFSSRAEGFTIIAGKNGEGKSNLLNAISWCLYHQEPHGMGDDSRSHHSENRSLSVINNRYITELPEEKTATTSVKIWIQKGDDVYSISRVLTVIKHKLEFKELSDGKKSLLITNFTTDKIPKGCEIINQFGDFVVKKKGPGDPDFHDTIKDADPHTILEEILPIGLSKYFLLDGEFLEGFWKDPTIIQKGIEQISQLHLLSSLKDHVDKMRIPSKGIGKHTDTLTTKIQILSWYEQSLDEDGNEKFTQEPRWKSDPNDPDVYYHATGKPRIIDLTEDKKKMEDRLKEISSQIAKVNVPTVKLLKQTYDEINQEFENEEKNLRSIRNAYRYNLISRSPYVFLKDAIESSVGIIEERMSLGDLPVRQRRQFADDLLQRGNCICGEDLHSQIIDNKETNKRVTNINNFRNNLTGKDDLDSAVDMRYDFKHDFIDKYDTFLKLNFGDPRIKFTNSETRYLELKNKLAGITIQLQNSGDNETEMLIQEQEYLLQQMCDIDSKISEIKLNLAMKNKEMTDYRIQLDKELKKNALAKKLSHELTKWEEVFEHISQVYDELKNEIRIDVQNNTWKNFQELLVNSTEFETFKIESDYSVYLLDNNNVNKIRNLSAGQSLILTLAFVAALREPTGYKFPLVVDSPLGKIDSANRYNIGTYLPDFLPDEQLTLLVTDTEYAADLPPDPDYPKLPKTPVGKLLEQKIALKHFKIQKEKSGLNKGNSTIKPAKLVFNNEKLGWMVDFV